MSIATTLEHPTVVRRTPPTAGQRLLARATYTWHNSPQRTLRFARRVWDGRGRAVSGVISSSRSGGPSIAYLGLPIGEKNILQLLERLRADESTVDHARFSLRWAELRAGRWPAADIVAIGAEDTRVRGLPAHRSLVAPFRVHLVVGDGWQDGAAVSERKQFARNQRRRGWTLERTTSPSALDFFYHRMHVPTMRNRHGERGRTESMVVAEQGILRHGCLFFVREAGIRVAGGLCHFSADGTTITTRLLGVLDGAAEQYRAGALKAFYYLLLDWAERHGIGQVDLFGTEALLSKGIFQWKRKLNPRVVLPPNHFATKRMYLHVRNDTPQVRDFLVANPMLTVGRDGSLCPVYFTDPGRPPRTDIAACQGLPPARVLDLDEFLCGAGETP